MMTGFYLLNFNFIKSLLSGKVIMQPLRGCALGCNYLFYNYVSSTRIFFVSR